jgi:cell division protein FtsZ
VGISELKEQVDTLIIIPNERLLSVSDKSTSLLDGFKLADDILLQACKGISDVITVPGLVNVDFADVKTVMASMGDALMGTGIASGQNRAITAAQSAISSPLLEGVSIAGAMGVLVNITGGSEMTLHEVNDASQTIHDAAGDEANFIFGTVVDEQMKDEIRITVIATGFNKQVAKKLATPIIEQAKPMEAIPPNVKQLEKPAFMRKDQAREEKPRKSVHDASLLSPDELDIPTFLRKQMD